jgi:hypothetical protein
LGKATLQRISLSYQPDLNRRANHQILSSPSRKNILFFRSANQRYIHSVSPPAGALAIVTDVGRDAVDAWVPWTSGIGADGEAVWS